MNYIEFDGHKTGDKQFVMLIIHDHDENHEVRKVWILDEYSGLVPVSQRFHGSLEEARQQLDEFVKRMGHRDNGE